MELRKLFAGAPLETNDLLLLEDFQIGYLFAVAPQRALGTMLRGDDRLRYVFSRKCPPLKDHIHQLAAEAEALPLEAVRRAEDEVLWSVADHVVYNKCPEFYDELPLHQWDFGEVMALADLVDKVVIDVGAGTGHVTLQAAEYADWVFAVEPCTRLRRLLKQRASELGLTNVFVIDGFGHDIPLPKRNADVLLTSYALGWSLEAELEEFERVVKYNGQIIHCPGSAIGTHDAELHQSLISSRWKYQWATLHHTEGQRRKYWKTR